jgi:hypothetical protein
MSLWQCAAASVYLSYVVQRSYAVSYPLFPLLLLVPAGEISHT